MLDEPEAHGIEIIAGQAPRATTDGLPSHSIYFRDLDGNLLELMAADQEHARATDARSHRPGPPLRDCVNETGL